MNKRLSLAYWRSKLSLLGCLAREHCQDAFALFCRIRNTLLLRVYMKLGKLQFCLHIADDDIFGKHCALAGLPDFFTFLDIF